MRAENELDDYIARDSFLRRQATELGQVCGGGAVCYKRQINVVCVPNGTSLESRRSKKSAPCHALQRGALVQTGVAVCARSGRRF